MWQVEHHSELFLQQKMDLMILKSRAIILKLWVMTPLGESEDPFTGVT